MEVKTSSLFRQPAKTLTLACIGFLVRLFTISETRDLFKHRVEIVTPISDWKRAYEAVHLWNSGLDPYSGGIFHEYPISLQFYKILTTYFKVEHALAATDVITGVLLQQAVYNYLTINNLTKEVASSRSLMVLLIHLFSPINLASCAGMSTAIFTNFLIAIIYLILPMKPFKALTCVMCAFLVCNNIHYSSLIIPVLLCMEYSSQKLRQQQQHARDKQIDNKTAYYENQNFSSSLSTSAIICLISFMTLLSTSYLLMGNSWSFLKSTYWFVFKVQDLTPNIGMFWYFFTEMFDQFLDFFIWIVQINSLIHVVPLCIHFRDQPFHALYLMIVTSTIFQPYPSMSNIGLVTSLMPQCLGLFENMRHGLKFTSTALTCISLWPIFWHLWIVMGTANANFYFGATLAFTIALILFTWDLIHSYNRTIVAAKQGELQQDAKKHD